MKIWWQFPPQCILRSLSMAQITAISSGCNIVFDLLSWFGGEVGWCWWLEVSTWFLWLLLLHRWRNQCDSLAITKYGHSNYIYWETKEMITVWVSGHEQSTVSWTWTKILVITCCPCTSYSNWRIRMTKFRLVSENKCRLKSSVQ